MGILYGRQGVLELLGMNQFKKRKYLARAETGVGFDDVAGIGEAKLEL